ncbi:hypothetical protein DYU11_25260 [Fibrisoma montanum]|uniref:Uncharacterized protein n=1 Tax=Fibrisoma montanum TaxID=2305895 RepID=A0A418M1C8_9BACT|nr:hypothetical protein [Fibrisoma montanum]RIV19413.1 hypothetical protein DYU11_25260 [Fibrisoma montanum]
MENPLNQYNPMQTAVALLQPTVSYAQKRADADRRLALQAMITQQQQQEAELAQQRGLYAQQTMAALLDQPFLEADQNRFRDYLDSMRETMNKRVQEDYDGDYDRYEKYGLQTDMQQMALSAVRSPLYKAAQKRRTDWLLFQKDQQDGKIDRYVSWRLKDGTTKTGTVAQNYADFDNGLTEDFSYNGGYKVSGKWKDYFSKTYSPRAGVLGRFAVDQARPEEIAQAIATEEGLTGTDASQYIMRTANLLTPTYYKYDPRDPYKEEDLALDKLQFQETVRSNRADEANAREANRIRAMNAKTAKQALGGAISSYGVLESANNIITRAPGTDLPGAIPASFFDANLTPETKTTADGKKAVKTGSLVGFDGQQVWTSFVPGLQARKLRDGTYAYKTNQLGKAYVAVPNGQGGLDFRATDLTGLDYEIVGGGPIYADFNNATLSDARALQDQVSKTKTFLPAVRVRISSEQAKRARSGKLFDSPLNLGGDSTGGYAAFGNVDTPTGKGAYTYVDKDEQTGRQYYEFDIVFPSQPTAAAKNALLQRERSQFTEPGQTAAQQSIGMMIMELNALDN